MHQKQWQSLNESILKVVLGEAWTSDSVMKNAEIGSKKGGSIIKESVDEDLKSMVKGVRDIFKDTRKKIDVTGWKTRVHKGKHPDVKDISKDGNILFAINPKTGEEEHIASGNLSSADIKKFKRMYGLK